MRTLVIGVIAAQIVLGPSRNPSVISVDVELVNVLCSVREKNGAWARDLTKNDFEVREDGRARPISHFAPQTDAPLTVALLLDVSGSVANVLGQEKAAAKRFFREVLRPGDDALLAGFSSTIPIWQDLTGSVDRLDQALDRASPYDEAAEVQPRGGTLLYDAINLVASRKLKPLAGRKTMILITDGRDNGSIVTLNQAVQSALQADTVVFAIHYGMSFRLSFGMRELTQITEATGGRAFHVGGKMTLERIFEEITEEMRNQYSIGFAPNDSARTGQFHKLEVRAPRRGVTVSVRSGFYR